MNVEVSSIGLHRVRKRKPSQLVERGPMLVERRKERQ
jgi:hypothetical protein